MRSAPQQRDARPRGHAALSGYFLLTRLAFSSHFGVVHCGRLPLACALRTRGNLSPWRNSETCLVHLTACALYGAFIFFLQRLLHSVCLLFR